MIQIRKLRSFTPKGESEPKKYDKAFEPDILIDSLPELFENLETYVGRIQQNDRWNCYYTLGATSPGDPRDWLSQDILPFDIDGITVDASDNFSIDYLDAFFTAVPIDRSKCVVVFTGNGFQVTAKLTNTITDKKFFKTHEKFYKLVCEKIASEFALRGLAGTPDPVVFSANRLFRLPGTVNRKPGKPERKARIIEGKLAPQDIDLNKLSGAPLETEQVAEKILKRMAIDEKAVEDGCNFLKWAKANPGHVSEPQWYAALSIIGRFPDGNERAHAYSKDHHGYTPAGTERKLAQAIAQSGPRTCGNVDQVWGLCSECPNFGKVTSPITLRSRNFIATRDSGFYTSDDKGRLTPAYEDLSKFFDEQHSYKADRQNGSIYCFDGKKYAPWTETMLAMFAQEQFDPSPKTNIVSEFTALVQRTNPVDHNWFQDTTRDKINFANGILDHKTAELSEHSAEYGFLYTLPFAYNPASTCPNFDKFLLDVTEGDREIQEVLMEFVGYAICDTDYWLQKALLLVGEGSNGKSTFFRIVKALLGETNTHSLSLTELQKETFRSALEGKLLNIAEEMPLYGLKNTELFKKLLDGGTITTRKLYQDLGETKNNTKFIFACNEIPSTSDLSHGLFRRLAIIPFKAHFEMGRNADINILAKVLPELPGVFNRAYAAYKRLLARGHLHPCKAIEREIMRYKESVDVVGSWLEENIEWTPSADAEAYIGQKELYTLYVSECTATKERPATSRHFFAQLRRHITDFDKRVKCQRGKEGVKKVIHGVKVRSYSNGKDHAKPVSPAYHESQHEAQY